MRSEGDWLLFCTLLVAATVAQLFEAKHDRQSYYPHFVFFFAAVVLLDALPLVVVVAVPHVLEWVKDRLTRADHRKPWYIQPFNIAAHIIPAICAHWLYYFMLERAAQLGAFTPVMAAVSAVLLYVGMNHVLVGHALLLARGVTYVKSGVFSRESLLPDIVMALLGYVLAVVWSLNPWLSFPALSPLLLMYQALKVPQLKQDAQTDGKTGLWNAKHFAALYEAEIERARRFARPLSLIMADLDLLRNINNTYGHLAGDAVLAGIGEILRRNIREYDIAGRFGGEEFALALPETGPEEAREIAERLREAVASTDFAVSTSPTPIHVTMSFGIASFPEDAFTSNDLVHEADVAVYQAKLKGRNCVVSTVDVPHYVKLGVVSVSDRLHSPPTTVYVPREIPVRGGQSAWAANGANPLGTGPRSVTEIPATPLLASTLAPESQISKVNTQSSKPEDKISNVAEGSPFPEGSPGDADSPQLEVAASVTLIGTLAESQSSGESSIADSDRSPERSLQEGAATSAPEPAAGEAEAPKPMPSRYLPLYVAFVTAAGIAAVTLGSLFNPNVDLLAIGLLTCLAAAVELLQIDAYGDNTVSVSVALVFAAALIAGVPGLAVVSLAIAGAHYLQVRPALYKTAFNWATHVLAGLAPVVALAILSQAVGIVGAGVALELKSLPALAVPMFLAAVTYFLMETGLVACAIGLARGTNPLDVWRSQFRWLTGHYLVLSLLGVFLGIGYAALGTMGVLVFLLPVLMMRFAQKQYLDKTQDSVRELKRMNEQLRLANGEVLSAHSALGRFNDELFLTLAKIIDARDPFVGNHAAKVAEYATAIATELGLSVDRVEQLRQAGFLHDIGKLGIPEAILHKPARLTTEEYETIKMHPALGAEFLEMCQGLRHVAPLVRHHHERWDGKGYPDRLKGEEISLEARILAVCDAVEAMASDRPYRKGMSLTEVINEVKRCSGTQFDPAVAEAFCLIAERERERFVVNSAMTVLQRQAAKRYAASSPAITSQSAEGATSTSDSPLPLPVPS
jgi:diguanylate cyclase (GGDEF)-like protein/putative nucleotidyltransferase with HDIG domain